MNDTTDQPTNLPTNPDSLPSSLPSKPCRLCHQTLPLTAFYRHKHMLDGHLNRCIACYKKRARLLRDGQPDGSQPANGKPGSQPIRRQSRRHTIGRKPARQPFTLEELCASFDLAYRKWLKRRGLVDYSEGFNFQGQAQAERQAASSYRRRKAREHRENASWQPVSSPAGGQPTPQPDPQAAALVTALDACPETLPESLLLSQEKTREEIQP